MSFDPREAIISWKSGTHLSSLINGKHDALIIAEMAIGISDEKLLVEISAYLNQAESHFVKFRKAQIGNDAALSINELTIALEQSRKSDHRDHLLEARIRMEHGIMQASLGDSEQAGIDLKWSMERFSALDEGHIWHGIAMINLASWHRARNEWAMALAIYSGISRFGPHSIEVIALSRYQAAEIYLEIGHEVNALRNYWIAYHGFMDSNMVEQAIEAGLHWLDLGLSNVHIEAITMDVLVESASPRDHDEVELEICTHPNDVKFVYNWMMEHITDFSGDSRPDLHVLVDAAEIIGENMNQIGIEDPTILVRTN
jgi:tetratricopeptide (TPR) repeat protein